MPPRTNFGELAFGALRARMARSDIEAMFQRLAEHEPAFAEFLSAYEAGTGIGRAASPVQWARSLAPEDRDMLTTTARGDQHRFLVHLTPGETAVLDGEGKRLGLTSSKAVALYVLSAVGEIRQCEETRAGGGEA